MVNTHSNAIVTASAETDEKAGSPPVSQTACFRIDVADENSFSLGKLGAIRHNYHLHPLMQMGRLAQLAKSLVATEQCRFIAHDTTVSSEFHHEKESPDGRSIEEVFRRIEEPGSWVALYNVQTDPTYNRFVRDVMDSASHIVDGHEKIFDVRGFIFISAPPSVTPLHIDRENNFWLQVHGRKTLNVWERTDHDVVTATDVEDFIVWGGGAVRLKDEMLQSSIEFDCGPGDGVYFPSTTPHMTRSDTNWTQPGNGVAVSIGMVFYSDVTRRAAYVHTVNQLLRRHLGWQPRVPQQSALLDGVKYPFGRLAVAFKRRFRGYKPPPSF